MMHPFGAVVGVFDEDLGSFQGAWGQLIYSLQFYETDEARGFVRGAKWNLMPTGGPLGVTRPFPWGYDTIWGEGFHAEVAKRVGHSAVWGIIAEDLPEEHNRVVLDPVLTDAYGNAAPRLIYKASDNTEKLLAFHLERARESMEAAGAKETVVAPQIRETGWHLLGTAKMGVDPATSVVDPEMRAHDVPNLFIADGSIWPTSSGTNPTATIAAMALRFAEGIVRSRNLMEVA
jgi:choline dehydrogenase-like flavoprotein